MAFLSGKSTNFMFGQYDLSTYLNTSDVDRTLAALDTTTYGSAGSSKTYIAGLQDGKVSASGLFDGSATGIDSTLQPILAAGTIAPLTFTALGAATIGNMAKVMQAECTDYKVTSPVAGVVSLSVTWQPSGGVWQGVVIEPPTVKSAAGNSTATVDNTAATTNGGVGNLHVTAVTSGTATAKIQHSTDNSTFSDYITFTPTAAISSQQLTGTGTVNRYTRGAWTGTFAQTFALAFARY